MQFNETQARSKTMLFILKEASGPPTFYGNCTDKYVPLKKVKFLSTNNWIITPMSVMICIIWHINLELLFPLIIPLPRLPLISFLCLHHSETSVFSFNSPSCLISKVCKFCASPKYIDNWFQEWMPITNHIAVTPLDLMKYNAFLGKDHYIINIHMPDFFGGGRGEVRMICISWGWREISFGMWNEKGWNLKVDKYIEVIPDDSS